MLKTATPAVDLLDQDSVVVADSIQDTAAVEAHTAEAEARMAAAKADMVVAMVAVRDRTAHHMVAASNIVEVNSMVAASNMAAASNTVAASKAVPVPVLAMASNSNTHRSKETVALAGNNNHVVTVA